MELLPVIPLRDPGYPVGATPGYPTPPTPGYPVGATPGYPTPPTPGYPVGATPGYPTPPTPGYPVGATPGYPTPPMPGYPPTATGYPAGAMVGYPYAPGMPPYVAYSVPASVKKPIYFPLTRRMPVLLQVFGMLLYSLIMALGIMGCVLTLLRASVTNANVYVNLDGSANGLSIVITIVLILLFLPFSSLLCGAFFGSWRGLIVSLLAVSGGLVLAHVTDSRFGNPNATVINYLTFAAPAAGALVTGLVYERRKYAAWWKSMFTMFLGTTVLVIWFFVFIYIADATSPNLAISVANTQMTLQNFLAYMAISFGCLSLLIIPLLGIYIAGIEGIIHSIIVKLRPTR